MAEAMRRDGDEKNGEFVVESIGQEQAYKADHPTSLHALRFTVML